MPACACDYKSGANSVMWVVKEPDCALPPFTASGTTFNPDFSNCTNTDDTFLCGLESFNLTYGPEIQEIFVAALAGSSGTVEGVKKGNGEIVMVHNSDKPLGDIFAVGKLHDFCVSLDGTVDITGDSDAALKIVGRFRCGQVQLPFNLNGEVVRITVPIMTHGVVYGDLIGAENS